MNTAARTARKASLAPLAAAHRVARATGPRANRWCLEANLAALDLAALEARIAIDGGTFTGWADVTRAREDTTRASHLEAAARLRHRLACTDGPLCG